MLFLAMRGQDKPVAVVINLFKLLDKHPDLINLKISVENNRQGANPHPQPFPPRGKGAKPLSLGEITSGLPACGLSRMASIANRK